MSQARFTLFLHALLMFSHFFLSLLLTLHQRAMTFFYTSPKSSPCLRISASPCYTGCSREAAEGLCTVSPSFPGSLSLPLLLWRYLFRGQTKEEKYLAIKNHVYRAEPMKRRIKGISRELKRRHEVEHTGNWKGNPQVDNPQCSWKT